MKSTGTDSKDFSTLLEIADMRFRIKYGIAGAFVIARKTDEAIQEQYWISLIDWITTIRSRGRRL